MDAYLSLLKNKTIAILWLSQLSSAIGDQIYLISSCWLAAQISPSALAIVVGAEYGSAFLFSLWAGVLTDRYSRKWLMICADLARALAVVSLSLISNFHHISTWHLALVGIILGAMAVLFDPCLVSTIPALIEEDHLVQTTNGLIDFTKRLARTLGPALVALFSTVIPIEYLFNIDALSFIVSAIGIILISKRTASNSKIAYQSDKTGIFDELMTAWNLITANTLILWELVCFFFANVAYAATYTVGLPLLAKQKFGDNISAYGFLISVYGIASILANIFIGNRKIIKPALPIFAAYICWGIGFLLPALAPNIVLASLGLAIAAFSGPVIFVTIVTLVQKTIPNRDMGKVYSFRTAIMYCGLGIGLILSSFLYANWQAAVIMPWIASTYFVMGFSGILRFYKEGGLNKIDVSYK